MIYGKAMLQAFPNNYLTGRVSPPARFKDLSPGTAAPPEPMAWAHPYWLLQDLTVPSQSDQGEAKSMQDLCISSRMENVGNTFKESGAHQSNVAPWNSCMSILMQSATFNAAHLQAPPQALHKFDSTAVIETPNPNMRNDTQSIDSSIGQPMMGIPTDQFCSA